MEGFREWQEKQRKKRLRMEARVKMYLTKQEMAMIKRSRQRKQIIRNAGELIHGLMMAVCLICLALEMVLVSLIDSDNPIIFGTFLTVAVIGIMAAVIIEYTGR